MQHLLSGDEKEVHTERLIPFTSRNIDKKLLKDHVLFHTEYIVDKLLNLRILPDSGQENGLVKWRGFEDDESSWEPAAVISEDVPKMMSALRKRLSKKGSVYN